MAYATIDIQSWDGSFHFELGVRNEGTAADVREALRARIVLLFQSAAQQLAQSPLKFL